MPRSCAKVSYLGAMDSERQKFRDFVRNAPTTSWKSPEGPVRSQAEASDAWADAGVRVGVEVGKWFGNVALDRLGLTPEPRLKKEQEKLSKLKAETEQMRQREIQEKLRSELIAADAEREFKTCMIRHANSETKKIPLACQDVAILFAQLGGARSDKLLDYRFE